MVVQWGAAGGSTGQHGPASPPGMCRAFHIDLKKGGREMVHVKAGLLVALVCALCAIPAVAAPKLQPGVKDAGATDAPSFEDLDKNHDGKLVRSEMPKDVDALKQLRAHFREADLDGNGWLSKEEYQRYVSNIISAGV
ncbi:EF-hand domain-containing protein [Dyella ginsengisoli]|uniref:EF-hand domain-containing protein n=2 Tax=Dyella ginsengisoli TaxID=363848 RepID=A0ABW8JR51_9GAMM